MHNRKNIFLKSTVVIIILTIVLNHVILVFAKDSRKENNILFILIETLRTDHLGCYGYKRNTSPNIDRIASEGILFTNFYSVSPWTNPTVVSLFTGRFPQVIFSPVPHEKAIRQAIPKEIETLAEVLMKKGYHTAALVDHPGIIERFNYDQGFNEFIELFDETGYDKLYKQNYFIGTPPSRVLKKLSEQLDKNEYTPFFIYIHLMYPHQPYVPPFPFKKMFGPGFTNVSKNEKEGVINMYDGEIRYTDELIGNIFDYLRRRGLLNNTYLIITADHGEGFWEHGLWEHGNSLYNELLKVPLVIYPPGGRTTPPEKVDDLVSNIDLFPTIMDFANIKRFPKADGKSLSRYLKRKIIRKPNQIIFSESPHSRCVNALSCQTERYKFIFNPPYQISDYEAAMRDIRSGKYIELYDIKTDPLEKKNLAPIRKQVVEEMGRLIIHHKIRNDKKRTMIKIEEKELDKDTIKKLKSLGYLQ